jgi:NDP-sugar pyrophosphorylase family protein
MTLPTLAILAGGLATRLGPITELVPKALVRLAGEPFLAHQLRLAKRQGFGRVRILTGHLGHMISDFVGDGSAFGLEVSVIKDRAEKVGTGGAVRDALRELGESFFCLYGDSYLDVEVKSAWSQFQADKDSLALMAVLHNNDQWDSSNVIFQKGRIVAHEKGTPRRPGMDWIDYGFSIFRFSAFSYAPSHGPFDLSMLTAQLAKEGKLAGYEVQNRFYEIGKPESLLETEAYLSSIRS